ncbi:geranylgeranyl reductase family protein [Polaribacter sp. Z014]|uniref:geranylgeranyl reductase family protein n=1 Tax=unclassified Polaribacter TaxID=196858 RepID=UPI00193BA64C|nr:MULTISPECIES: geranylgeranyl reductase family protein [unclassified Polaribacter]MCL7764422.1 geranylgeranyl reductase family protein [Polaribacter sp. Z014]QVY67439.1 geranylgeranyl reductase family protein [Polaribacter sp. Q13]
MRKFDVAVIGSGPSGASAALKLAENGVSVVLIEKEVLPRYKTCGGGFVYRGRRNMPFDISSVVEREFKKIDIYFDKAGIHLTSEREEPIISMIMRDDFDNFIVEKAKKAGIVLLQDHKLKNILFEDKITLQTSKEDVEVKFVIAADGALSTTAKLAGWEETRHLIPALEYEVEVSKEDFDRLSKEVRFDFDAVPLGYGWSFPKENHLSIGVASTKRTKLDLKKHYKEYLVTLGINEVVSEAFHGFQIPVSPRTDGFFRKNVFLVGDAAGFADPITAEGISNAILSGVIAADAIIESKLESKLAEELYDTKLNKVLIPELKTGVYLSKLFYENEKVRHFLMKKYGDRFCEAMTDIFMGERSYPVDIKKKLKQKLKNVIFKN